MVYWNGWSSSIFNKIENLRLVYPRGKSEERSAAYGAVMSFFVWDFT